MDGETNESLYRRATVLIDLGRVTEALSLLGAGIARDPEALRLHGLRAVALLKVDRAPEVLEAARTIIHLDPEEEWGYRLQALALSRMGRNEEALASALEAAKRDPWETEVKRTVASCAQKCGKMELALEWARGSVADFPEESASHLRLGSILWDLKQVDEGEASFRKALELNPTNTSALSHLGYLLLSRGRINEGFELLLRAVRVAPADLELQSGLYNAATGGCEARLTAFITATFAVVVLGRLPAFPQPLNWLVGMGLTFAGFVFWRHLKLTSVPPEVREFCRQHRRDWIKGLTGDLRASLTNRASLVQELPGNCLVIGCLGVYVVTVMWMTTGNNYAAAWLASVCVAMLSVPLDWICRPNPEEREVHASRRSESYKNQGDAVLDLPERANPSEIGEDRRDGDGSPE